jgi:DNA transformation protein
MARSPENEAAMGLARDLFAALGELSIRRMFGGAGLYANGVIFAIVFDGEIYLKADAASEPLFRAAGSRPFEYRAAGRDAPTRLPYWTLPEAAVDDPETAAEWARRALSAERAAPGERRRKRPRGGA